jgi:predicted dehydrogenase
MKDKLKFGIIGCGWIGFDKHFPSLAKQPDAEIAACCDIVKEKAQKAAKEYGAPGAKVYTNYKEMLKDESIDVVHVATPNMTHREITIASLKAGKHVLCEKPLAVREEDAKAMLEAAKTSGKKLTVGFNWRYRPACLYLRDLAQKGYFGDIYFAKAHALRRRGVPTWGSYLSKKENGGGALADGGPHSIDLTLWVMDNYKPVKVSANMYRKLYDQTEGNMWGAWDPKKFTVEDAAFGFITMENGATIIVECSWSLNMTEPGVGDMKTTICGTKAGADMDDPGGLRLNTVHMGKQVVMSPVINFNPGIPDVEIPLPPGEYEARQWIDSIKNGTDPMVLPEQAYVVTRIIDAMYRSAETGETVYL